MTEGSPLAVWTWTILASFAGALTALSYRPFRGMSAVEVLLALIVGASFAIFVGPWVVRMMFGAGPTDIRLEGAIFYGLASGSNILIPMLVRRISGTLEKNQ